MIQVKFDPLTLTGAAETWWKAWEDVAKTATLAIIDKWETTQAISSDKDFDPKIWTDLKNWLLENVFHYKCAYCEHLMKRQSRAAEHFRPKAGVKYRPEGKKKLAKATWTIGQKPPTDHPGYFWLAYDWRNLLPSCDPCNSGQGKNNQFPVRRKYVLLRPAPAALAAGSPEIRLAKKHPGYCYPSSAELDIEEEPLLLNPYFDDPREHIVFGEFGIEAVRCDANGKESERGRHSIQVFNLANADLRTLRHGAQVEAENFYLLELAQQRKKGLSLKEARASAHSATVASLKPEAPFRAAVEDWLNTLSAGP